MTIDDVARDFTSLPADRLGPFDEMAEAVYYYQLENNAVYSLFSQARPWSGWQNAPFIPVEAFKLAPVTAFPVNDAVRIFESSGTGHGQSSRHYIRDISVYERAVTAHFEHVFGPGPFTILAHLPGYARRGERSSLVYMMEVLIARYGSPASGFFLDDSTPLVRVASGEVGVDAPLLLFGAAFGLLDLVESDPVKLPENSIVVETGGMKTYRHEITRTELHRKLADGFALPVSSIWSEYGMCELLSQCYTRGGEVYFAPPWVRVRVVDPERPDRELPDGRPGALQIFDLANLYSVSAIQTEDLAVRRGDGFEVLGRLSGADLRGCNFLLPSEQSSGT